MAAYTFAQILLTPLYLEILGIEKFGILMILLNIITFAVFGITWFSGSLTRVLGEYWSKNNLQKFNETLVLGKYIFTIYSTIISILGIVLFHILSNFGYFEGIEISTIFLISAYFILNYEALSEGKHFLVLIGRLR